MLTIEDYRTVIKDLSEEYNVPIKCSYSLFFKKYRILCKNYQELKKEVIELNKSNKKSWLYWIDKGIEKKYIPDLIEKKLKCCSECNKIFKGDKKWCDECQILRKKRWKENLSKSKKNYNCRDPEQYAKKHGISVCEAKREIKKFIKSPLQIKYWLEKGYTEEEAKKKISEMQRKRTVLNVEYWLEKGYTEEEAKKKISEIQKERANKVDRKNIKTQFNVEYWLEKGYTEEEAKKKISENSYKAIKAKKEFIEKNNVKLRSLEYYIVKYGEKKGREKYKEITKNYANAFSKISNASEKANKVLSELDNTIFKEYKTYGIYNGTKEYFIIHDKGYYFYDMYVPDLNLIIEYNGDYWHLNPKIYNENEMVKFPKCFIKPKEKWEQDRLKIKSAEENGKTVFVIWESDDLNEIKIKLKEIVYACEINQKKR